MAVVRKLRCVVREIVNHGERVYTVVLEPSEQAPRFTPGQFLHLALDPYRGDGFWPESRVFSIASSPNERSRLKITYAVKGTFTTRLERELHVGRVVWVKLPYGDFTVELRRDAVLFAGGTGVTAFTAFLQSMAPEAHQRVRLFYGARTAALLAYREVVDGVQAAVPLLKCSYVCEDVQGRLSTAGAWPSVADLEDPIFYLSGPPTMLAALTRQLLHRGVPLEDVRTDAWE